MVRSSSREASTCLGARRYACLGPSRSVSCPYKIPSAHRLLTGQLVSLRSYTAKTSTHYPSPSQPHPCLQRRRFSVPRHAIRSDDALHAIGQLLLLPTPSSPHCTLQVSEHDPLWQPPADHSDERPPAHKRFIVRKVVPMLSHPAISRER